jgi:hypothetical protein
MVVERSVPERLRTSSVVAAENTPCSTATPHAQQHQAVHLALEGALADRDHEDAEEAHHDGRRDATADALAKERESPAA